jgi:hypothetical protein
MALDTTTATTPHQLGAVDESTWTVLMKHMRDRQPLNVTLRDDQERFVRQIQYHPRGPREDEVTLTWAKETQEPHRTHAQRLLRSMHQKSTESGRSLVFVEHEQHRWKSLSNPAASAGLPSAQALENKIVSTFSKRPWLRFPLHDAYHDGAGVRTLLSTVAKDVDYSDHVRAILVHNALVQARQDMVERHISTASIDNDLAASAKKISAIDEQLLAAWRKNPELSSSRDPSLNGLRDVMERAQERVDQEKKRLKQSLAPRAATSDMCTVCRS